jgi:NAD(P)-dependent dehydrogenase (short-subunit alcohol dehydrogenase family)
MKIIVTGASRGIGFELVRLLAQDGSHRIMAVSRNAGRLEILKHDCDGDPGEVIAQPFDLERLEDIPDRLVPAVNEHFESLDILVNNAGLLVNKPFEKLNLEDFQRSLAVNYLAPAVLIQGLMPLLSKSRKPHVINISSMGGVQGSVKFPGLSSYSSAKAALGVLTECLAEEFKDSRIRFNTLALGSVQTEMLEEAFPGYKAPLSTVEMAAFIKDFAENGGTYFNGKIIPVSLSTP